MISFIWEDRLALSRIRINLPVGFRAALPSEVRMVSEKLTSESDNFKLLLVMIRKDTIIDNVPESRNHNRISQTLTVKNRDVFFRFGLFDPNISLHSNGSPQDQPTHWFFKCQTKIERHWRALWEPNKQELLDWDRVFFMENINKRFQSVGCFIHSCRSLGGNFFELLVSAGGKGEGEE